MPGTRDRARKPIGKIAAEGKEKEFKQHPSSPLWGKMARRARRGVFGQHTADHIDYFVSMFEHIHIPKPDHPAATRFEPARARFIAAHLRFIRVRLAIEFDDQFRLRAEEIGDVGTDGDLTPEAKTPELFAAKQAPELAFAFGHVPAKFARAEV
jgi:hypothetical protein